MSGLEYWTEEPTRRSGHRQRWPAGTSSYVLVAAEHAAAQAADDEMRLARAAMAWLFRLLPGDVRACDAHLLGPQEAQRARERYGLESYPLPRGGITVVARQPDALAEFLVREAGNDDALFIRPMGAALAPDLLPWLCRTEIEYVSKALSRYGAVGLVCLTPVSFEIVSAQALSNIAETAASVATEHCVDIRPSATRFDRNWPGWLTWFKLRLR